MRVNIYDSTPEHIRMIHLYLSVYDSPALQFRLSLKSYFLYISFEL